MNSFQIVSLVVAAGVALVYLLPLLKIGGEDPLVTHIKNVVAIRDQYKSDPVTAACNALIQTLLGTNK